MIDVVWLVVFVSAAAACMSCRRQLYEVSHCRMSDDSAIRDSACGRCEKL